MARLRCTRPGSARYYLKGIKTTTTTSVYCGGRNGVNSFMSVCLCVCLSVCLLSFLSVCLLSFLCSRVSLCLGDGVARICLCARAYRPLENHWRPSACRPVSNITLLLQIRCFINRLITHDLSTD